MSPEQAVEGLRRAAEQRQDALRARKVATNELIRYCLAAKEAGVSISQIAREAGLSRQGVYDLLAEPASR